MMASLAEPLTLLAQVSVVVFVVTSMPAMGMSQRLGDVFAPLRDIRATLTALAVNLVVAPLFAWTLTRLVPLEPAHATGLLLLGGAAGAPFLPKLAEAAGASASYASALWWC